MGYTHYWSHDPDLAPSALAAALVDVEKIVKAVQRRGIILRNGDGLGKPVVFGKIWINGAKELEEDHEAFSFPRAGEYVREARVSGGVLWDFCKTARKPYDLAVCSVLLVLKHHLGKQIRIASNGGRHPKEWLPAEKLVEDELGYHVKYRREETLSRT